MKFSVVPRANEGHWHRRWNYVVCFWNKCYWIGRMAKCVAAQKDFIKNLAWLIGKGREFLIIFITLAYPLIARVVGASQMTSQAVFSIFLCSRLPSGTWRTPGLSIPWWCLPSSSSLCLVFFPLSLCLARWFWPDLMNGRHVHTTSVCVSLRLSLIHIWRCRRDVLCRSRWSPYH